MIHVILIEKLIRSVSTQSAELGRMGVKMVIVSSSGMDVNEIVNVGQRSMNIC